MSRTHAYIMGLNTGVFLSVNRGASPAIPLYRWSRKRFLMPLFVIAVAAISATPASTKEKPAGAFDDPYSGFSENWSGAYLGASIGGGWGNSRATYDRNGNNHLTPETIEPSGYLASLTYGYNYRLSNNIVVGLEGDIGIMDLDAGRSGLWDGHIWQSQFGGLWATLRGRLGYAFDNVLVYGTGGLAMMETNERILGDNDATQNTYNEAVHTGWVLGAGVEYALSENISTKLEYLHMEFPQLSGQTNNAEPYSFENSVDIVRVGLNYKF